MSGGISVRNTSKTKLASQIKLKKDITSAATNPAKSQQQAQPAETDAQANNMDTRVESEATNHSAVVAIAIAEQNTLQNDEGEAVNVSAYVGQPSGQYMQQVVQQRARNENSVSPSPHRYFQQNEQQNTQQPPSSQQRNRNIMRQNPHQNF